MSNWKTICQLQDIPVLGSRRVKRERGGDVALFRSAKDEVYALLDRCPHKGGPLSQGLVFGSSVSCPLHGWVIALDSGHAMAPDEGVTIRFSVQVQDQAIQLDLDELQTLALDGPSCAQVSAACASPCGD